MSEHHCLRRANPAGRLGVAADVPSYAAKKERDHGITLRQVEEELVNSLYQTIECFPKRATRFAAIRTLNDLRGGGS